MSYNFANKKQFNEVGRKIRNWIYNIKNNKLQFSDDMDYFYKVKYCKLESIERKFKVIGTFELIFVCEPYQFFESGVKEIESLTLYNPGIVSKPIYRLVGEGNVTLKVNNSKIVTINLGQELIIDTTKRLAYRQDGEWQNTKITGHFEDLWLEPGNNDITITCTNDIKVYITPNWRCL